MSKDLIITPSTKLNQRPQQTRLMGSAINLCHPIPPAPSSFHDIFIHLKWPPDKFSATAFLNDIHVQLASNSVYSKKLEKGNSRREKVEVSEA